MNQQQHQEQASSSGLTRYKSAPSSYFAGLFTSDDTLGGDDFDHLFNPRASSPETNRIFARFLESDDSIDQSCSSNLIVQSQLGPCVKYETVNPQSDDFLPVSQMMYRSQPQQGHNSEASTSSVDNIYGRIPSSMNSDRGNQIKNAGGNTNLIRHSSSPAGFFSNMNIENEFETMRGTGGNFRGGVSTNADTSVYSFKNQTSFSSDMQRKSGPGNRNSKGDGSNFGDYIPSFPVNTSWDDDNKVFSNVTDNQAADHQNHCKIPLSHHLSLPKDSSLVSEILMQDSIPCKMRAKRGFATHPRSIAERVRRTRISERMRKLQELVPNMDKQTSTADMLDLAVDYIKDLQTQAKMLSDNRAKCTCSTEPK